jgi:hypothetical protein
MTSHYCCTGALLAVVLLATSLRALADSPQGLVAYYPLNGDGVDASGNGHDGTVEYATPSVNRFGQNGKALLFDGTNSFISVPDSPDLRLSSGDFTISAWIFETERNGHFQDCIISKRAPGPGTKGKDGRGWIFTVGGMRNASHTGRLFYQVSGGENPQAVSTGLLSLNQWHQVAMVYHQATASVDLYIDGAWDSTAYNIPPPNPDTAFDMHIGNDSRMAYSNAYVFHGKISDVRIYNYAMTAQGIAGLYETGIFLNGMEFTGGALTRLYGGLAAGQEVVVESSPDLNHWTPIETNIVSSATLSLTNYVNPAVPAAFFRVSVR